MGLQVFSFPRVMKRDLPSGSAGYWSIPMRRRRWDAVRVHSLSPSSPPKLYVAGYQRIFELAQALLSPQRKYAPSSL